MAMAQQPDSLSAANKPSAVELNTKIPVEVVYPLPEEQILYQLEVPVGTAVRAVIVRSGVLQRYPALVLDELKVGIFGKLTTLATQLRAKDRIEIYRPLIADPKEVRKQRAAANSQMKKGR